MRIARILAPFSLSALLFVLSYLSSNQANSGSYPVILLGIGIIMALIGIYAIFSDK